MATNSESEKLFILRFLSGYENGAWKDRIDQRPDEILRSEKAVDWLATRVSDRETVAIEHTIIEPFLGDKRDFANFKVFLEIEQDASLVVPGRWIRVFVPVGILENQRTETNRKALVQVVREWIKSNRLTLENGDSTHRCTVAEVSGGQSSEIVLTVKTVPLPGDRGQVNVRRQQTLDDLDKVIERALRAKLAKLVGTVADRRILLLERQHMILDPARIIAEIEKRKPSFSDLNAVDEIWVVDASVYGTSFGNDYLAFMRYEDGRKITEFHFYDGQLTWTMG